MSLTDSEGRKVQTVDLCFVKRGGKRVSELHWAVLRDNSVEFEGAAKYRPSCGVSVKIADLVLDRDRTALLISCRRCAANAKVEREEEAL